jgi:hypothetical protein
MVRLPADEIKAINAAADRSGMSRNQWRRMVLLGAADQHATVDKILGKPGDDPAEIMRRARNTAKRVKKAVAGR